MIFESLLESVLPTSRKGAIHRFYLRRGGEHGRWGLFIHKIVRSDEEEVFHNHPWHGFAFIFGSYTEETLTSPPRTIRFFNPIRHRRSHRVEISKPTWTVFLHFRRQGAWWFHDRDGNRIDVDGVEENPWRGPDA